MQTHADEDWELAGPSPADKVPDAGPGPAELAVAARAAMRLATEDYRSLLAQAESQSRVQWEERGQMPLGGLAVGFLREACHQLDRAVMNESLAHGARRAAIITAGELGRAVHYRIARGGEASAGGVFGLIAEQLADAANRFVAGDFARARQLAEAVARQVSEMHARYIE